MHLAPSTTHMQISPQPGYTPCASTSDEDGAFNLLATPGGAQTAKSNAPYHCLNRFEARCMAIKIVSEADLSDEVREPFPAECQEWGKVRKGIKHARKLAGKLSDVLKKINRELEESSSSPRDVARIHRSWIMPSMV